MADTDDPISQLFDFADEPDAKASGGTGGDTAFVFPDAEWVPGDMKGKSPKEVAEALSVTRRELAKQNEALSAVTKVAEEKKAAAAAQSGGVDPLNMAIDILLETKVEKAIGTDPLLTKHKDEVMDLLHQINDPRVRMTKDAMDMVIAQVRGSHYSEGIEMTKAEIMKNLPQGSADLEAVGGVYKAPSPMVNVTPERKANLAAWFEGDLDAAKRNLLGGD